MEKVGVFLCECGPNIKDALDLDRLTEFAKTLEGVVLASRYQIFCSDEGKNILKGAIQEHGLSRVVIAACSPKEHELTFRKVLQDAGLNPFLLQMANIREQCAWVNKDAEKAIEKAKAVLRAAVRRVVRHEPLETRRMDCRAEVLVVGAGPAGISAALALAQKDRKVYLVEKLPSIGGKIARYEDVFPDLECAPCMLDPKIDEVMHNEQIEPLVFSEVQEVLGYYGNFLVKVKQKARSVDMKSCIGCGVCLEACPVATANEYSECLDQRKAIYIPYAGAIPNVAVIDRRSCLRFQGQPCDACQKACPFGSIDYEETDQLREIHVGAIILATGFDLFDVNRAPEFGYSKIENVYTSLEFERLLSSTGPTGGQVLLKNGRPPKKIALLHCVGSRSAEYDGYCSGVCCQVLMKFARLAGMKQPGVSIVHLYSDLCLPGKGAHKLFVKTAGDKSAEFVRCQETGSIRVFEENGEIFIAYADSAGKSRRTTADMVVLAPAMEGAKDAEDLARIFDISSGEGRFFTEEHATLAPAATTTEGIFIAGCAQGPKDISDSVATGQAAAGLILSRLLPGVLLTLEPMIAAVDEDLCSGCKTCMVLCPYKAIASDEKGIHSTINEALCRGCGTCVACCPSGAIKARHFTDRQILAEIEGLLE